ncbi:MAG TPA: carboxymuconolactone decarboxylase family protein [Gemmatimonadales bacterium]|nr:carboxymuconolactone decarboxylase family protein [Gemmatimonadales bacterium]
MTPSANARSRRAAVRVPIAEPEDILGKLLGWYTRRVYGDVPDNALVLLHHRRALRATLFFEQRVAKFDRLDPDLKMLAIMAVAGTIGCSWCLDFGYYLARTQGLAAGKIEHVGQWENSKAFSALERKVLAYAEAMTVSPPAVTDEMVAELTAALGVPAVVELTKMIAIENERSRFNSALGLTSQGFSDRCRLPQ